MRELLRRAQRRGEVRADIDLDLGVDLMVGPLIYRVVTSGGDPAKIGDPREVLRGAMHGLSPR
jgi:Tetracyclin repressor-like, C-terminal domain